MEESFLHGFSIEEQKELSKSIEVEYLGSTKEEPRFPLKAFIDGLSTYRCFCNLICCIDPNPCYNLLFLIDTGNIKLRFKLFCVLLS